MAIKFLRLNMIPSYITLGIFIALVIGTFQLMLYYPAFIGFHPTALVFTWFYGYFFYKKVKFTNSMYRLIDSENAEERILHLYTNLSDDLEDSIDDLNKPITLYKGERTYKRAKSFTFWEKSIDCKIARGLYNIYY